MRIAWVFSPIALQRAEIVGIAELLADILEMRPVELAGLAEIARQLGSEVVGDAIVVEQRVVDIQKKDDVMRHFPPRSEIRREASAVRLAWKAGAAAGAARQGDQLLQVGRKRAAYS